MPPCFWKRTFFFCTLFLIILSGPPPFGFSAGQKTLRDDTHHLQFLENERHTRQTLQQYNKLLQKDPANFTALLQKGHLHLRLGWLYTDKAERENHFLELFKTAQAAHSLQPDSYEAKLLYIIARAKSARYLSRNKQVCLAGELKNDLELFMKDYPDDTNALYILSWLNFKVGRTSKLEHFLAGLLYCGLPDTLSSEKAVFLMQKAIAMRPDYPVYAYDLALFYERMGKSEEARHLFEQVAQAAPETPEDFFYRKRAAEKLKRQDPSTFNGDK